MLRVTAHPSIPAHSALVSFPSTGAIGIGTLQRATSAMFDSIRDGPPLDDEWNARLDMPTDQMLAASTHLIPVGDALTGQHTLHAAEAFTDLSAMLDHIPGVTQHARDDPDSGLTLRLTGVYKPPCNAAEDAAVGARFSAQVLLQPQPSESLVLPRLEILLQLLPLPENNRYNDSNEKLAARGKAIKALAAELRSRFGTRQKMDPRHLSLAAAAERAWLRL
jgi:hypothetical protein